MTSLPRLCIKNKVFVKILGSFNTARISKIHGYIANSCKYLFDSGLFSHKYRIHSNKPLSLVLFPWTRLINLINFPLKRVFSDQHLSSMSLKYGTPKIFHRNSWCIGSGSIELRSPDDVVVVTRVRRALPLWDVVLGIAANQLMRVERRPLKAWCISANWLSILQKGCSSRGHLKEIRHTIPNSFILISFGYIRDPEINYKSVWKASKFHNATWKHDCISYVPIWQITWWQVVSWHCLTILSYALFTRRTIKIHLPELHISKLI